MKLWKLASKCRNFKKILNMQIRILSSPILRLIIKSIKITSFIHNWKLYEWTNKFPSYFDTLFREKNGEILFGVEMNRLKGGYTSSGESGMGCSMLRYLIF